MVEATTDPAPVKFPFYLISNDLEIPTDLIRRS